MLSFRNLSLRRKQTLIIMLTSSVVLMLACAAFIFYEVVTFRRALIRDVSVLAEAIGNNCAAALDFDDPQAAGETLAALHTNDNIVAACVFSRSGQVFAVYQRDHQTAFVPPTMQAPAQKYSEGLLHLFRPIKQSGEMTGMIYVASDLRELSARLMHYLSIVGLVFLASWLVALALSSILQRLVSDPILNLAQVARFVALEKNYSVRATKHSHDELGQLVDGFNEMLAQIQARDSALQTARDHLEKRVEDRTRELESTHQQLLEASRLGGMAEVASNVLHNIGNVLNSVNVSASLVIDGVKKSKAPSLAKVVALLREHEDDLGTFFTSDSRGQRLPVYLSQLSVQLLADQTRAAAELDLLRGNIEHIKEIVAMQQSYARVSGVKEIVNLRDLVEDSLRMNVGSFHRHGVEIFREFFAVPPMNVEKHKILQILVNLVRNAKYACDDRGHADKRLTVRVAKGEGRVQISVMDNGVGIPPENLNRIFSHGFTTRKDGHGFGLHSGALAAQEMGGSLTVHSDGAGQGATFTLELPVEPTPAGN